MAIADAAGLFAASSGPKNAAINCFARFAAVAPQGSPAVHPKVILPLVNLHHDRCLPYCCQQSESMSTCPCNTTCVCSSQFVEHVSHGAAASAEADTSCYSAALHRKTQHAAYCKGVSGRNRLICTPIPLVSACYRVTPLHLCLVVKLCVNARRS